MTGETVSRIPAEEVMFRYLVKTVFIFFICTLVGCGWMASKKAYKLTQKGNHAFHSSPDKAYAYYMQAWKLTPKSPKSNYYLGRYHYSKEEYQRAKEYLEKADVLQPSSDYDTFPHMTLYVNLRLADTYLKLAEQDNAAKSIKKAGDYVDTHQQAIQFDRQYKFLWSWYHSSRKELRKAELHKTQPTILSEIYKYDSDITFLKTNLTNTDGIAVVIGNRNYDHKDIPEVTYASNDAQAMRIFLKDTLGYQDGNIIFMTDTIKPDLEMIFGIKNNHKGMLYDYIKPDVSDVFIYYSGHGAPDINTQKAYFVTKNSTPDKIAFTGYALDIFFENISRLPAKHITVVIDACFSGGTDSGKWIVSNASPALIKVSNPPVGKKNVAILTSSESSQISSWYPEKRHGLFTYFLLKAVNGDADKDSNRQITYKEIFDYVSNRTEGVPYWAKRLHGGRVQIPTLQSLNRDDVFISY